jgi:hypothetical protein
MMGGEEEVFNFLLARVGFMELKSGQMDYSRINYFQNHNKFKLSSKKSLQQSTTLPITHHHPFFSPKRNYFSIIYVLWI